MHTYNLKKLLPALISASLLSACSSGYVLNNEKYGPLFVKPKETTYRPVPKPVIKATSLSVAQQNQKAIAAFNSKGFEAVQIDTGVVIHLPPQIYFNDSDSSISSEARSKIAEMAQELNQPYLSQRIVEVSGHTDSLGNEAQNMALSKQRSLAATSELVSSNVLKTRLSSLWYGESRLRAPDINQDGSINHKNKHLNRRVEFKIVNPF